jgi:hypothetical protein
MNKISVCLSQEERTLYLELMAVVQKNWDSWIEMAEALAKIRDLRLYREEFASFEEFCKQRFGMTRSRAYQLIQSAEILEGLPPNVPKPRTEAVVRVLAKAPQSKRPAVMQKAGPAATAREVEAIINPRLESKAFVGRLDEAAPIKALIQRAIINGGEAWIKVLGFRVTAKREG